MFLSAYATKQQHIKLLLAIYLGSMWSSNAFLKEVFYKKECKNINAKKAGESGKPLKEWAVAASKAIFIDVKFIRTFVLCICLEHWLWANYCARNGTQNMA